MGKCGAALFQQGLMLAFDDLESADAAADIDADLLGVSGVTFNPELFRANSAAAMANWMKRPIFLISFFSM